MEDSLIQSQISTMEKTGNLVLDIEALNQSNDKCCCGSPKMTRALSRKGSNRMERRGGEEHETEDNSKKLLVKVVPSQLEQLKVPLVPNKALVSAQSTANNNNPVLTDCGDTRTKKLNRFFAIHPRKVVLLFATVSSLGTMILIYFTLAINRRGGA